MHNIFGPRDGQLVQTPLHCLAKWSFHRTFHARGCFHGGLQHIHASSRWSFVTTPNNRTYPVYLPQLQCPPRKLKKHFSKKSAGLKTRVFGGIEKSVPAICIYDIALCRSRYTKKWQKDQTPGRWIVMPSRAASTLSLDLCAATRWRACFKRASNCLSLRSGS